VVDSGASDTHPYSYQQHLGRLPSFNGFDKSPVQEGQNPAALAASYLNAVANQSYEALEQQHIADHQRLFNRVTFNLDTPLPADSLPTDERIRLFQDRNDPQLPILLFHYGRYLMIASSRPGGQPANLQGLWNDSVRPPWSCNWTLNINAQMNYWLVESCNLAECHEPLLELIADLAVNGQKTAEINYGARGWVAHHNTDLWRQSAPVGNYGAGDPVWANWPMGGAWLCQHLWEHFAFGGDMTYLREKAYPLMKGAAEFCLDWLIDDGQGHLVTAPSFSPELHFLTPDGRPAAASMASTMDMAIIRDLFSNCIQAAHLLQVDAPFADLLQVAKSKLVPFQIGARGQLQEWMQDFLEEDVHHRHVSHLFAVHPGNQITPDRTPDLAAAAHHTLELRGDKSTGWSQAWKINHYARLRDSNRAYQLVRDFFSLIEDTGVMYEAGGVYANLFDAHPPFQIDGNFGYSAGIVELLLQSHSDEIHLLPTLPKDWSTGSITGLRARGGFEVDIAWADRRFTSAKVHSKLGAVCRVRTGSPISVYCDDQTVKPTYQNQEVIEFQTEVGKTYVLAVQRDLGITP
jgi:alpha-L-fucosidase 2